MLFYVPLILVIMVGCFFCGPTIDNFILYSLYNNIYYNRNETKRITHKIVNNKNDLLTDDKV